ncbi:uncharacterized protein LOC107305457 [Oryza brachyantha]|uniref:uncharacterized protein LOC107305457 n=1 Tax=Oryza brachyantha TaxID=4533 RepID=UPI001ADAF9EF|nr:uncharacterized protein LOC107305457 [Oryza brachyantha]
MAVASRGESVWCGPVRVPQRAAIFSGVGPGRAGPVVGRNLKLPTHHPFQPPNSHGKILARSPPPPGPFPSPSPPPACHLAPASYGKAAPPRPVRDLRRPCLSKASVPLAEPHAGLTLPRLTSLRPRAAFTDLTRRLPWPSRACATSRRSSLAFLRRRRPWPRQAGARRECRPEGHSLVEPIQLARAEEGPTVNKICAFALHCGQKGGYEVPGLVPQDRSRRRDHRRCHGALHDPHWLL